MFSAIVDNFYQAKRLFHTGIHSLASFTSVLQKPPSQSYQNIILKKRQNFPIVLRGESLKTQIESYYLIPEEEIRLAELKFFYVVLFYNRHSDRVQTGKKPTPSSTFLICYRFSFTFNLVRRMKIKNSWKKN